MNPCVVIQGRGDYLLVNDYSDTNQYPSAISVNLQRDSDNLMDFI